MIWSRCGVIRGVKLFQEMKGDIIKHLSKQPTLEDVYSGIGGEDVVAKRINDLLTEEDKKT